MTLIQSISLLVFHSAGCGPPACGKREKSMGANVIELTDGNFDAEVVNSAEPVLVDFWAPWCMPCRQIAPMIDELAEENSGAVKVGKVNIDDNKGTARAYGIEGIPTLLVFKGGEVVQRFQGAQPKPKIQDALDQAADDE
jgi:thioredoxin 1